ncbi:hypothetical protein ZIOFF_065700 [Zingiber officinale]|uniref:F-box domain-containing protein n=1 Tax=Zingiber officinale TaxID=94328 RepID=A0A8J5F1A4_ZINOF|nr:hypothetical protein ZIOFF_065700 [Zingiber officinale]
MTMSCTENLKNTKTHLTLISGLPDDLAILCLSRVPRRYHRVLKCVSRRWRELLGSEEWHISRRRNNTEECWVYAVCKVNLKEHLCYVLDPDPTYRNWKLMQCMRTPCSQNDGMSIIALGKKVYLLGGCTWQEDATDDVHCYDASSNKWAVSSRMPTARCYFASTSLNEKLYIGSGFGLNSKSPKSWDIYNSNSDSWISHKNPLPNHDIVKFIAFDGKLYTIHRSEKGLHYAGIYDPASATWQITDDEIALCSCGPTVVVDGTLYMLDETLGARLMKWENAQKEWALIGRLSHHLIRPPCHLVAIGRSIYVIGQGLSTMVIDVDEAAKGKGILVGFSFKPGLPEGLTADCAQELWSD